MLEGVDRLIDLTGFSASPDIAPHEDAVLRAIGACDTAALSAIGGQFAGTARVGKTVRLARTIGLPLRYFVAKMYHGPFLVVSDRIDRIFDWCQSQRIGWQFDPAYTRMVPAHYLVELDQVGCPDPAPRYQRFFDPPVGRGSTDLNEAGSAYIAAASRALKDWIERLPVDAPIAVAFSGGIDSTATLLLARHVCAELGRDPNHVRAFTLDFGGGEDAAQAERAAGELGLGSSWERVDVNPNAYDLEAAIRLIEDYQP